MSIASDHPLDASDPPAVASDLTLSSGFVRHHQKNEKNHASKYAE